MSRRHLLRALPRLSRAVLVAPLIAPLAALCLGLPASRPAAAQPAFPSRTITMVVPFAAGGPTDTVARLVAESMGRDLGQVVVVENVGGAGGTLGAARTAQARPDGYTLLMHHIGMATTPTLYRRLSYDAVNGFAPIGLVTEVPMTIIARKDIPAANLAELVALVRKDREKMNYANAGIGAASHLCGLLFQKAMEAPMTTVPYRGTGPAMTDLIGGTVDVMCDQTTNTTEQIRAGAVKVFAVTTAQRLASMPDLPTAAEAGLPGMEVTIWHGLYAPKGTDPAIIQRLSRALQTALRDDKVVQRFADLGTTPVAQDRATPAAHAAFWQADIAKWKPVIEAAGQYAD